MPAPCFSALQFWHDASLHQFTPSPPASLHVHEHRILFQADHTKIIGFKTATETLRISSENSLSVALSSSTPRNGRSVVFLHSRDSWQVPPCSSRLGWRWRCLPVSHSRPGPTTPRQTQSHRFDRARADALKYATLEVLYSCPKTLFRSMLKLRGHIVYYPDTSHTPRFKGTQSE